VAEPICPVVPSGCYLLQDAFSGSSVVSWIFLIMAMLLNYDCWANEFEYHTYMQLYTLPMRKEKLYVVRTVVRSLCSVLHICAAGTVLFVLGTVNYGMGKELLAVVATGTQYAVMPIASIVTKEILFAMLYLVFVVIFTIGLSFLLKTKMNTLMVCTVTCMTGIVHVSSYRTVGWEMNLTECMNPFNLQRAGEIVTGEMGMDGKYMLFLLLYILLLVMVGILGICFRED
jgi:ABC-2 type transport system permease protein